MVENPVVKNLEELKALATDTLFSGGWVLVRDQGDGLPSFYMYNRGIPYVDTTDEPHVILADNNLGHWLQVPVHYSVRASTGYILPST